METTEQPMGKQPLQLADYIMVGVLASLIVAAALLVYSYRQSIGKTIQELGYSRLAIATTPEGATILLDGNIVGVSPLAVKTFPGAHIVSAKKEGYKHTSLAVDLEHDIYQGRGVNRTLKQKASPWAVNISLEQSPADLVDSRLSQEPDHAEPADGRENDISSLRSSISDLRELVLADPESAVSLSVMKGRVETLERDNSALRDELKELRGTWMQFISILATILIGLIGVAATVFIGRRKSL